jgi:osmotically-inducible protein OsmY
MPDAGGGSSIEMWLSEHEDPGLDSALQERVHEELRWESGLDASSITVGVHARTVTLGGSVRTYPEKRAAEMAACRVPRVQRVINRLSVDLAPGRARPDDLLREEVTRVLEWDTLVPTGRVLACVVGGCVMLSGEVDWDHQRVAAEHAVSPLMGVRAVENHISVRPKWTTGELQTTVSAALRHRQDLHTQHVHIETVRGMVVLQGYVPSLAERSTIERVAWEAPGVLGVVNELSIER